MGARHTGREAALQMLFQMEGSSASAEQTITLFWRNFEAEPEGREYADAAVRGVGELSASLDQQITKASSHWRIERMARVDRNILRLGTWELLHRLDVPRAVILDEAVELAKEFGTEESSAFVNGVLNKVAELIGRKDEDRPER
ncbi:transcription antitermination factor NusB [bacterium]|nr:MAG: transcription antitermination factor NusB [bacterium]